MVGGVSTCKGRIRVGKKYQVAVTFCYLENEKITKELFVVGLSLAV